MVCDPHRAWNQSWDWATVLSVLQCRIICMCSMMPCAYPAVAVLHGPQVVVRQQAVPHGPADQHEVADVRHCESRRDIGQHIGGQVREGRAPTAHGDHFQVAGDAMSSHMRVRHAAL